MKKPKPKRQEPKLPRKSIRIIGGSIRGRKIPVADIEGLRPTGDRMRETLFNWLAPYIQGARVLDAFAGTGVLSLEALSRGASEALLIEKSKTAVEQINQSCSALKAKAEILHQDAISFFQSEQSNNFQPFDIVFLDPPFADSLLQKSVDQLVLSKLLAPRALIYLEQARSQPKISIPTGWTLYKDKTQGEVSCQLYQAISK